MAPIRSNRTPSGFLTFVFGIACLGIFAGLIVFWIKASAPEEYEVEEQRAQDRAQRLAALQKEEQAKLTTPGWIDKEKGVVQLPIETAMAATITELKAKKVAATQVKVQPPLLAPAVDPALYYNQTSALT
nr:hypothetical protein [Verrucomicrobiota bacterium]